MSVPHFLVIPYPILGHVIPHLQFSQVLAKRGCKITFVNSEFNLNRVKTVSPGHENSMESQINMVSLPDGLDPDDDRNDVIKLLFSVKSTMPEKLQKLIEEINALDGENKINCIVVSMHTGWALEVGQKLGIKGALLFPGSATSLGSRECIPRLIDEGIIDPDTGLPTKKQEIQFAPNMPMIDTSNLTWCTLGKTFFGHLVKETQILKQAKWWLCNTTQELELGALSISPKFLPIGPLLGTIDHNTISFWQEDTNCLDWLNQQPSQSVIYISFGSLVVIDPIQFKELALGLDLLNKPFLWVVRLDNNKNEKKEYPSEFHGSKGKIVNWAPQKKVLCHPAIACFISHCGWNSTIEGVYSGVPFLCWPFFSDQFQDKAYICDVWKVGLGFQKDENGIISRDELKNKVEQLLSDEEIRERSLKLKEVVMNNLLEGGQSLENTQKFINWAKK